MYHGTMQWLTASGEESDCPLKPSGSTRHELARTACLILYKAYVRLVDLCLFECELVDRDGLTLYRNNRATCNAEAARRDTMGVLCAAMTIARHALALEGLERVDHRVI